MRRANNNIPGCPKAIGDLLLHFGVQVCRFFMVLFLSAKNQNCSFKKHFVNQVEANERNKVFFSCAELHATQTLPILSLGDLDGLGWNCVTGWCAEGHATLSSLQDRAS